MKKLAALLAFAAIATPLTAATTAAAGVDPLTADIDIVDAQRFAGLMKDGALPTAEVLQRGYLDGAGRGVRIFTPNRIVDAANLARVVAARQDNYRQAIRECLPQLPALRSDLRAIYLAFAGLVPERPLPAIHVVFGASNSGGTANSEAQVIGLEVVCQMGATPDKFRATMRDFFAHETVHTWQRESSPQGRLDPLLDQSLREGVADYLASLVTGQTPDARRDAWAREREAWLWQEFQRDRQALKADSKSLNKPGASPHYQRWLSNYGSAPEGWPYEAGYWIGMRIAEAYVARARDKHAAIRDLIELKDPNAILEASGYGS
ncbi:DUF2268 domain-containing putative Zn-dependent protease [Massilia norwichensis]|uniref:DUF2268 domain-containing putative Zn-dependent protease n=1 Tax=Massilia norwichensis TaxID=1442366 RepID=A0ABT2ABX8_9BURK|nr:DUF2268 domain-containing putative Zn-dependent protease [Massilia norwichensis]